MVQKAPPVRAPRYDPRFTLHQTQPRADKLDARQRRLCQADPAFLEALKGRVENAERFAAFLDGGAFYVALGRPCATCGDFRKRTRDRSCYDCHLMRGGENFKRMRAGLAPEVLRCNDGHLDLLTRKRAERQGDCLSRAFGKLEATRWPLGRLEITFPDGHHEIDLARLSLQELVIAMREFPMLAEALNWAGWTVPYDPSLDG